MYVCCSHCSLFLWVWLWCPSGIVCLSFTNVYLFNFSIVLFHYLPPDWGRVRSQWNLVLVESWQIIIKSTVLGEVQIPGTCWVRCVYCCVKNKISKILNPEENSVGKSLITWQNQKTKYIKQWTTAVIFLTWYSHFQM